MMMIMIKMMWLFFTITTLQPPEHAIVASIKRLSIEVTCLLDIEQEHRA